MFYAPSFFSQNTLPQNGNVGINTTNPSVSLEVNGNAVIDSSLMVADSLEVGNKLKVQQDLKVFGQSVFVDKGKFKDKLTIDGLTKMNGDAKVFGDFKVKSLENTSLTTNRLLSITPTGKVVISTLNVPQDDTYVCSMVAPWAYANNSNTDIALCPNFNNVGIGTTAPLAKLHVGGSSTILNTKVGIGVPNASLISNVTDPQLLVNVFPIYNRIAAKLTTPLDRSIYFVPKLDNNAYSTMSKQDDVGMFWSDNGSDNNTSGFVLAPQSASNIGMRMDAMGRISFNTPVLNTVQFHINSTSLVGLQVSTPLINSACCAIKAITNDDTDVALSVAKSFAVAPNTPDVFQVMGNGTIRVRTDSSQSIKSIQVKDMANPDDNTNDVFRVMSNGTVFATRVRVMEAQNFPDYVFKSDYNLMPLNKLEEYITKEQHLPNMPTAQEVEENGADLGEINRVLVEKVEELTLYMIAMDKRMKALEEENKSLKK